MRSLARFRGALVAVLLGPLGPSGSPDQDEPLRPQFHFTPAKNLPWRGVLSVPRALSRRLPEGLRVLFDRTTLEVFANDGLTVVSERIYPTQPLRRLEVIGAGTAIPGPVRLHELRSVWP